MSRLCERFVEQTSVADKQRRVLVVRVEGPRAGPVVDVKYPRDEGEPHAGQHARVTFRECVAGVTPRPTARISRESGCIRRGASAHPPSSVVGRAARAGANGRLRNEAGGAGAFRCDAAPTLALLLLWHVQTLVDPEQLSTRCPPRGGPVVCCRPPWRPCQHARQGVICGIEALIRTLKDFARSSQAAQQASSTQRQAAHACGLVTPQ